MGHFKNQSNRFQLISTLVIVVFFSACSDDNNKVSTKRPSSPKAEVSKSIEKSKPVSTQNRDLHGKEHYEDMSQPLDKATWSEKGKFKKEFAEDCLVRETINSKNKENDRKRWEKPCKCIAEYMSNHLTDEEAEEYLKDDNHPRSLQIRFEAAAYHCLQKPEGGPKDPVIFKH